MEMILIVVSGVAITFAVIYLFISFKKPSDEYENDFRDNNNFNENTAQDFRPSYNDNYSYSSYDESSFNWMSILSWVFIIAILIIGFWADYNDDDDYYDDGYHRRGHYGAVYYGSSRRYSGGYSSGGLRRSGSSFRGRSYGGGGK